MKERLVIWLLSKVKQPYSPAFFEALARILPVMGLEGVALRCEGGRTQVLMTRRPGNDLIAEWAGRWHIPGTITRVGDTLVSAFARLGGEFGAPPANMEFVYFIWPENGGRGLNLQLVFVVSFAEGEEPKHGQWFDLDALPDNCIDGHQEIARQVAARTRTMERVGCPS